MKAKKIFKKAPIDKAKATNEIIKPAIAKPRGLLNNAINDSINALTKVILHHKLKG